MKTTNKLLIGLIVLAALTPLGLILPQRFKAIGAWGEWGIDKIEKLAGYLPEGLAKLSGLWKAPISNYTLKGSEGKGLWNLSLEYIVSAILGIILVVAAVLLISRLLIRKEKDTS